MPDVFSAPSDTSEVTRRSVRGGVVVVIGQSAGVVLTLLSTPVLARLVTPAEFGQVAMVLAIANFLGMFRGIGLVDATVQADRVDHRLVSTMFWANATLGLLVTLAVVTSSPLIVWYYNGNTALYPLVLALSVNYTLSGLYLQHNALLRRQMRFKTLTRITVVADLLGIVVAILVALPPLSLGVWALVAWQVTTMTCLMLQHWLAVRWLPDRPRRGTGARRLVVFGGNVTGSHVVAYAAANADNVIVGRAFGEAALGLYGKAYGVLMLPIMRITAPIGHVAIPALGRLRDKPDSMRAFHRNVLWLLSIVALPIFVTLAVAGEEFILVMLGPQWREAVPIFQALVVAGPTIPVYQTLEWLMTSNGHGRRLIGLTILRACLVITGFLVGVNFGVEGVAWGLAIGMWVGIVPIIVLACRGTSVGPADYVAVLTRPVLTACLAGLGGWWVLQAFEGVHAIFPLLAAGLVITALHLGAGLVFFGDADRYRRLRSEFRPPGVAEPVAAL